MNLLSFPALLNVVETGKPVKPHFLQV